MNMQQICVLVQENKDVSHFAFLVFLCMLLYIVLCDTVYVYVTQCVNAGQGILET